MLRGVENVRSLGMAERGTGERPVFFVVLRRPVPVDLARDFQRGEGARLARKLLLQGVDVVDVDVGVAKGVDKIAWRQAADMRDHDREECVAGNVERHAQALLKVGG